jgi:hypothetical protein
MRDRRACPAISLVAGILALAGVSLAARLPGLRAMPIFGDEAMKLHWALLVRENPFRFALVSMQAPVPPLHSWLLAIFLPLSEDPVRAGRLLSVFCGALTVPAFFLLFRELRLLLAGEAPGRRPESSRGWWAAAVLLVSCPYLAFQQRLALVDALFLFEATLAAFLAIRLAFDPRRSVALALGAVMGATMLTRQDMSYILWALPPLARVLAGRLAAGGWPRFLRFFVLSAAIGLLLWLPAVAAAPDRTLVERLFHSRFLFEAMGTAGRIRLAVVNTKEIAAWLWTYMTPPVFLLAVVSLAGLLRKREWRVALFLLGWIAAIVLPLAFFGQFLFSRYGVMTAIPLLASIGLFLDRIELRGRTAAILTIALLLWPVRDLVRQARDWRTQPLVPLDRSQYVTGWPAGAAIEKAIGLLDRQAKKEPLWLLIPRNEGNPMDVLWLHFARSPDVRAFSVGDIFTESLLRPGISPGTVLMDSDPRRREPARSVARPAGIPIFHVSPEPIYTPEGPVQSGQLLSQRNRLDEVGRFWNPSTDETGPPTDGIVVYRVR